MTDPVLPTPGAPALEHSQRLVDLLQARLAAGTMPFVDFMQAALYEPGLGYYMAGARKFGPGGDFVTAPELSPLFGEALAVQCRELFAGPEPCEPAILEMGAGSGALASSLLIALGDIDTLRYAILEPSPDLRDRQRDALQGALGEGGLARVSWLDTLPVDFDGVIIANEVVDALPVERFVKRSDVPGDALRVFTCAGEDPDALQDAGYEADEALAVALARLEQDLAAPLPAGYASEINLLAAPWLASLAASLRCGVVLIADYGYPRSEYYSTERGSGTLACYYRHRAHGDPYRWPGLQDITAHVDFTTLAEAGIGAGMSLLGYGSQGAFLLGNDLLVLAEARARTLVREVDRIALSQVVKTLTLPGEMGERFQIIAFGKHYHRALRGFAGQDLTHRL